MRFEVTFQNLAQSDKTKKQPISYNENNLNIKLGKN